MAKVLNFTKSQDIGVYARLTNTYCLVSAIDSNLVETLEYNLFDIPVIPLTIDGTRLVGRMTVGNSQGLLVPSVITE